MCAQREKNLIFDMIVPRFSLVTAIEKQRNNNMKKILSAILAAIVICFSGVPVFAASPIPHEAELRAASIEEEIVKLEEGVYAVGDEIFIDVNVYQSEHCGEQNCNIPEYGLGNNPSEYAYAATPYGSGPASSSSVWDWSDGDYIGDFEMKYSVYTNYRFIGYSSYTTTVSVEDSPHVTNSGVFHVSLVNKYGLPTTTYHCKDGYAKLTFTGIKPTDKISFLVGKANDSCTVEGRIKVSPGE